MGSLNRRTRAATLLTLGLVLTACQTGNEVDVDIAGGEGAAQEASDAAAFTVDGVPDVVATIATGLDTPWGLAFLPDARAVVTERDSGRVLLVSAPEISDGKAKGQGSVDEVGVMPDVAASGESGLLGVAVSPTFADDGLLYFYLSTAKDNRVVRAPLANDKLGTVEPVLTGIPNGTKHAGGRLLFGPDGNLYVATGETGKPQLAQRKKSLAGKILRVTPGGKPAPGNPFGTAVWSWGHRNVEGLAFDGNDLLWASEFGDQSADELNRIVPGENYGWPLAEGTTGPKRFAAPHETWPTEDASPAGLAYSDGYLWMAALRGERLWRIKVADGQTSDPTDYFEGEYGRLRTVTRAPDGRLWLATSNQDGRGEPGADDDRILLIEP
ncbi:MAG: PQQ-dependent sugar dehydrogenase [Nocardioidaceae bacterium]|nr:PQQ-dependent sugar dehydrogenase [Nocardioidaceae bacterium]